MTPTIRAVPYTRVSDPKQVQQGLSLETQLASILAYMAANGLTYTEEHYHEPGQSAFHKGLTKRPAMARLLRDATAGKFDAVVVWTFDRTLRDNDDENLYAALKKRGVKLHTVLEGE